MIILPPRRSIRSQRRAWLAVALVFSACNLPSMEAHAGTTRIYSVDKWGNTRHDLPSWTVRSDGRIIETNQFGNLMYHKPQYQIRSSGSGAKDRTGGSRAVGRPGAGTQ